MFNVNYISVVDKEKRKKWTQVDAQEKMGPALPLAMQEQLLLCVSSRRGGMAGPRSTRLPGLAVGAPRSLPGDGEPDGVAAAAPALSRWGRTLHSSPTLQGPAVLPCALLPEASGPLTAGLRDHQASPCLLLTAADLDP